MWKKTFIKFLGGLAVAAVGFWHTQSLMKPTAPTAPAAPPSAKSSSVPQSVTSPQAPVSEVAAAANGDFDYYVVSLSWSPTYCLAHPKDRRQCGDRGFGFVLHGLWPQRLAGGYPENCPVSGKPSTQTVQRTLAFMPSERLIAHEWSKHGTCTGLTADQYFLLADQAFAAIKQPAGFNAPTSSREMSAKEVISEFITANPGFPDNSVVVKCSGTELEEVRVCMDMQLKPRACGKGVRSQCRGGSVQVRAVR
jgi:ribonuclease T2